MWPIWHRGHDKVYSYTFWICTPALAKCHLTYIELKI